MLIVRFDTRDNKNFLNKLHAGIESTTPQILDAVGRKLVGLARVYFDNLSRGGSSFSGRKWMELQPSTVAKRKALLKRGKLASTLMERGVVTGEMRESLAYFVYQTAVKVTYTDPKAKYFNVHRRLIPSRLPNVWRDACELEVIKASPSFEKD